MAGQYYEGIGRRKQSTARVRICKWFWRIHRQ